jgi:hypothetical protein
MARAKRRRVHRQFYPSARKGQRPQDVQPIAKADPLITSDGVKIDVLESPKSFTPKELQMYARWLYALSHEAEEIAKSGHISATKGYNVDRDEVVSLPSSG